MIDPQNIAISGDTGSISQPLDIVRVIKISQAISSEIVLDKLLSKLMKILMENAGAKRGVLLLLIEDELFNRAEANLDSEAVVVQETQVNECEDLPLTVINYVERSRQDVVLGNAFAEDRFTTDPYVTKVQLKFDTIKPYVIRVRI